MNATKKAARQWFAAHDGEPITTRQHQRSGAVWEPEPRVLHVVGNRFFLDHSEVRLTPAHHVTEVTDDYVKIEWRDALRDTLVTTTQYGVL